MKTTLRQVSAICLLLLVAVPFLISFFFVIRLCIIKIQVSEDLEYEQLQTITVAESNIKWIVPGKEVLLNGNLFDIKSFKQTGDNLIITGLYDKDEDYLQKHFIKIFHQKQQGNASARATLINLIFQPVFSDKNTFFKEDRETMVLKKTSYRFIENLASANSEILVPPPKAC